MKGYINMQSDDDIGIGQAAASSPVSGFEAALALIKLALDPRAMQASLDGLMAAATKAREERAAAANATSKLVAAQAEFAAKEAELESHRAEYADRWSQLDADRQNLELEKAALAEREDKLKHRMLRMLGRELHPMQSLPTFGSLEAEIYGPRESDAHFDQRPDGDASSDAEPYDPRQAPERLPAGVSLTKAPRRGAQPRH